MSDVKIMGTTIAYITQYHGIRGAFKPSFDVLSSSSDQNGSYVVAADRHTFTTLVDSRRNVGCH